MPERDEPPAAPDASPTHQDPPRTDPGDTPPCDFCGGETWWLNCKLLCKRCRSIVMSCGDL